MLLHLAIERRHPKTVEILLKYDADISVRDPNGNTPLHLAAVGGNEEITKMLLDKYAELRDTSGQDEEEPVGANCSREASVHTTENNRVRTE